MVLHFERGGLLFVSTKLFSWDYLRSFDLLWIKLRVLDGFMQLERSLEESGGKWLLNREDMFQ